MPPEDNDAHWMAEAICAARQAEAQGEVPVGAVIVEGNKLIASGHNTCITDSDPTAHAEIQALRSAGQVKQNYRLNGLTLYVTLEPCAMCLGALLHARIKRVVFGATDPKTGALIGHFSLQAAATFNHTLPYRSGVLEPACRRLLTDFFDKKRKNKLS